MNIILKCLVSGSVAGWHYDVKAYHDWPELGSPQDESMYAVCLSVG